jgi:hypothetical protein
MIGAIIDTLNEYEEPYSYCQMMIEKQELVNLLINECEKCPYIQKKIVVHSAWKPKIKHTKNTILKNYFKVNESNWDAVHSAAKENGLTSVIYIPADRVFIPAWLLSDVIEAWDDKTHEVYGTKDEHIYFHICSFKSLTKEYQNASLYPSSEKEGRTAITSLGKYSTTIESELKFKIDSLKALQDIADLKKEGYDISEIIELINEINKENNQK